MSHYARIVGSVMTWRRGVVLSLLGTVVVCSSALPALAASSPNTAKAKAEQAQIGKQINALRHEANEVSEESALLLTRLNEINDRKAAVEAQVADLTAHMNIVQAEVNAAQAQLEELLRQEHQAIIALRTAEAELAASKLRMQEQAVAAYVGKGSSDKLATFLLNADDVREVTAAEAYLQQVVRERKAVVERHRELEGQAIDLKKQMEVNRVKGEEVRNEVAARQAQVVAQKAELDVLNAQVAAEANAQAVLYQEVEAKRADILGEINSLQQQSDSIAAMLRAANNSGPAIPPGKGILANPVPGSPMTSSFGMRLHPILGRYILHAGQDYGASTGTPIRASADGTVVSASFVSGYGNYTCIAHGGGLASCYAHQSSMSVATGQRVVRNQIIGAVGNTGNSTGPHLHYEVRVNGNPVNPLGYL